MSTPYLVAIGTACMDEYYRADAWAAEGDKMLVHPMEQRAGGMIPNAACVMAGYGNQTYLLDYMNDGPVSSKLKENLAGYGLDTTHIVTDNRLPDAKCIIVLTPKERTILVLDFDRPTRIIPADTLDLLRGAAYVYTTMTELRRFENYELLADDLRSHGAKLVFDLEPSTFQDSTDILFSKADVLFFNETGLSKYCGSRNEEECIASLLNGGCQAVVTTLGSDGCDCRSKTEHIRLPGIPVEVCDTTGAGDTFNASFVHCLLAGASLKDAARFSNAAAARAVTRMGPKGGVASVAQVEDFMHQVY